MDDGEASAAGQATHVEKSAEGAAAGEAKSPGSGPTPPAAVSGLTSDTRPVGADSVGGEISSSRDQGLGPAVGERKRESVAGQDGGLGACWNTALEWCRNGLRFEGELESAPGFGRVVLTGSRLFRGHEFGDLLLNCFFQKSHGRVLRVLVAAHIV